MEESAAQGYQIRMWQEDGYWFAYHPELAGVLVQGDSYQQAVDYLAISRNEALRHLREYGLPIPLPDTRCRMVVVQGARLCL